MTLCYWVTKIGNEYIFQSFFALTGNRTRHLRIPNLKVIPLIYYVDFNFDLSAKIFSRSQLTGYLSIALIPILVHVCRQSFLADFRGARKGIWSELVDEATTSWVPYGLDPCMFNGVQARFLARLHRDIRLMIHRKAIGTNCLFWYQKKHMIRCWRQSYYQLYCNRFTNKLRCEEVL